jgi:hypothetical protein
MIGNGQRPIMNFGPSPEYLETGLFGFQEARGSMNRIGRVFGSSPIAMHHVPRFDAACPPSPAADR